MVSVLVGLIDIALPPEGRGVELYGGIEPGVTLSGYGCARLVAVGGVVDTASYSSIVFSVPVVPCFRLRGV